VRHRDRADLDAAVIENHGRHLGLAGDRGRQAVERGMVVHPADPLNCETAIPALIGGIVR